MVILAQSKEFGANRERRRRLTEPISSIRCADRKVENEAAGNRTLQLVELFPMLRTVLVIYMSHN